MQITITRKGEVAFAHIEGDITHAVSGEFQGKMMEALESAKRLVLDFSSIGILTSAGLRALLLLHRQASSAGKRLLLACVPEAAREVMVVTGFWDQFESCPSVQEAIDA